MTYIVSPEIVEVKFVRLACCGMLPLNWMWINVQVVGFCGVMTTLLMPWAQAPVDSATRRIAVEMCLMRKVDLFALRRK